MSEIGDGIRPLPPIDRQKSEEEKNSDKGAIKSCISNSRVWVVNAVFMSLKTCAVIPGQSPKKRPFGVFPLHLLFPFSNPGAIVGTKSQLGRGEERGEGML